MHLSHALRATAERTPFRTEQDRRDVLTAIDRSAERIDMLDPEVFPDDLGPTGEDDDQGDEQLVTDHDEKPVTDEKPARKAAPRKAAAK